MDAAPPSAPAPSGAEPSLALAVIGWEGHIDAARHIAGRLASVPGVRLLVVYSNAAESAEAGPGEWLQLPNDRFFGAKFERALSVVDRGDLMIVQADASCADWPGVVARYRECRARRPRLGLWAPTVSYTPWTPRSVDILALPDEGLTHVAHTDGIVLAFTAPVLDRLRALDYRANHIGWGIDWIAICHCLTHGLDVVRDDRIHIHHPRGRGYNTREATRQWLAFMAQTTESERCMFEIIKRYTEGPVRPPPSRFKRWVRRVRGRPSA